MPRKRKPAHIYLYRRYVEDGWNGERTRWEVCFDAFDKNGEIIDELSTAFGTKKAAISHCKTTHPRIAYTYTTDEKRNKEAICA